MSLDPHAINLERYVEIGELISRDAELLTDRWSQRARQEQPTAQDAHHAELRDELPSFLRALGTALGESEGRVPSRHRLLAVEHGEQRWESGWRLGELVRDYQILRLVLLDHLDQELDRPLSVREVMAIGLGLDEAIGAAVVTYVAYQSSRLRDADERIASVVDHALSGILSLDERGRIETCNPAAERIFGYAADALVGQHAATLFPELEPAAQGDQLEHWLLATGPADGRPRERDIAGRRRDGTRFPLDLAASLFHRAGRRYFTMIVRDITERKQSERALSEYAQALEASNRALAAAKLEAEAASRFKSEFLASMSHEIRTPMTAILGFSEVLASVLADPEQVEIAHTIKRNGEHLVRIVNDILDLAKIEAGKVAVATEPCDVRELVREVHASLAPGAEKQGVGFEVECAAEVPERVRCDTTRLRQILFNLVGNAIKFTPRGEVRLAVSAPERAAGARLEFQVTDTGIGMTPEQLSQLFEPVAQVHRSADRREPGTGLGLTISQRLARLLGGEITVASQAQHGSTFVLSLPLLRDDGPAPPPAAQDSEVVEAQPVVLRCRVLLAEDGRDSQLLISRLLTAAGAALEIVEDGEQALAKIAAAETNQTPFDVVLMDMQMPVLDGSAATRRLRARGCRLPIIALTASAMKGDREQCLALGCSDYLTKPIDRAQLLATVARWTTSASAGSAPSTE
ncbi:MAG: response regulator [Planctomycetaceae bacterium]|nr:response regulator [Planctomycetaceae bacterium]